MCPPHIIYHICLSSKGSIGTHRNDRAAPSGLDSSTACALHRCRRGDGFESKQPVLV